MLVDCRLIYTGLCDQKSELCRTGADLRRRLRSPQSGDGQKVGGPTQPARPRGD